LLGAEALDQLNAEGAQLVAHWRVDAGIAAGDLVACLAGKSGQSPHEGAADTENMNVHLPILGGGCRCPCGLPGIQRRCTIPSA